MKRILFFKTNRENTSLIDDLNTRSELKTACNYYENLFFTIGGSSNPVMLINGENITSFNKVYFYGISDNLELACGISLLLPVWKIAFFDTFVMNTITNNKLTDTCRAYANGIDIPKTVFLSKDLIPTGYKKIVENLSLPFVMKTTTGNKGKGVKLIEKEEDYIKSYQSDPTQTYIFQEYIENSCDFRVNVFGGKTRVITKRTRTVDKFRNNTHLGAREEFFLPTEVDNKIIKIAENMSKYCDINIAGVDVVQSSTNNKFYFLEINKDPGITPDSLEFEALYKFLLE